MASQDNARKAYRFLLQKAEKHATFTVDELATATNWSPVSVRTYFSKQLQDLVTKQSRGVYLVRPELQRMSEEDFLKHVTQRRPVFENYQLSAFTTVLSYEFLLPLTREDQLRRALDNLFYADTIEQRIREIGLDNLRKIILLAENETDDEYIQRASSFISENFGGYSISHVSGRFLASKLLHRQEAALLDRYIIDETTALVRFILPIGSTEQIIMADSNGQLNPAKLSLDNVVSSAEVTDEIETIRWLFFSFFAQAVVRTVKGEDVIWLLEDVGQHHRLYAWTHSDNDEQRGS